MKVIVEPLVANGLRGLLLGSAIVNVLSDVGSIVELLSATLDGVPDLSGGRGSTLSTNERVDSSVKLSERVLDVGALGETSSEEGSVQSQEDPRSALEEDGGEKNANPEEDLESGNNRHGRIIVLLHESTDLIGDRVVDCRLGLGRARSRLASGLGSNESGDEVGASVGCDMEDGVDGIRKEGKRVLGGEEPNKGHGWRSKLVQFTISRKHILATYRDTGCSHRTKDQRNHRESWLQSWHERAGSCRQRCHKSRQQR